MLALAIVLATPRPLPRSYGYETLPNNAVEMVETTDLPTAKVTSGGRPQNFLAPQLQLDIQYGLTDRVEVGFGGIIGAPQPSGITNVSGLLPVSSGLAQRIRWRLFDEGVLPVDLSMQAQIAEEDRELHLEGRLIVQRRISTIVRILSNITIEREQTWTGPSRIAFAPTLGATIELAKNVHLGAEAWVRWMIPDSGPRVFDMGPHVYAGPAMLVTFGRVWWSMAFYTRATDRDHELAPGDGYGSMWFRTLLGFTL